MKYILTILFGVTLIQSAYAASVSLVPTETVETGRVSFDVMLDTEGESVNALSGALSLPLDKFEVASISTIGSVISFWLTQPDVSKQRSYNQRKQIVFEGIMPGGFDGVRSPYYEGVRPGKLFSVTLKPIAPGPALILLDTVDLRANDGKASKVMVSPTQLLIDIPAIDTLPKYEIKKPASHEVENASLQAFLTRDDGVERGKWMLIVHDDEHNKTPLGYYVSESTDSDPHELYAYEWSKFTNSYIIKHQKRNRFIHIRADYADGSYGYVSIQPVENSGYSEVVWRILMLLALVLFISYGYYLQRRQR